MSNHTKILLVGTTLCLLGAGFGSAPVMAIGITLTIAGLVMFMGGRL